MDESSTPSPLTSETVSLRATCWGTRGSIPSPGPATARFGGNTACLEVRTRDDRCFVFDAGTGIRVLGRRLVGESGPTEADLFMSHFHWDHVQGIPFFAPLYDTESTIRIHGARQGEIDIGDILKNQMTPVYFPVPFDALAAEIEYVHLDGKPWIADGVEVHAFRVRHPADTYGYRITRQGASVGYIPDNELVGSQYPVGGPDWYEGLLRFLRGVDLLFHDAMFTDEEYKAREGWGHSTFKQAVQLAEDAGVRRLSFFHHAPEREDAHLQRILDELRDDAARRGSPLEMEMAAEGEERLVHGRQQ